MMGVRNIFLISFFTGAVLLGARPACAAPPAFEGWLAGVKQEALQSGISASLVEEGLARVQPDPEVISLDKPKNQPEMAESFAAYSAKRVNAERIRLGRQMLETHYDLLKRTGDRYGVAPQYIVALWGMETNYGGYTGKKDIIRSLATLAWNGRDGTSPNRASFFRKELLAALKIVDQGHFSLADMKGSWAGAFGQVQFMPTSFLNMARDGDGDGRIDIRENLPDAFASAANYLSRSGWSEGERWGRRILLPQNFSREYIKETKSLSSWAALGIKAADGTPLPAEEGMSATLVAPDGVSGKSWLVYKNFQTIKKWNNSDNFALSVGLLADAIAAGR